MSKIKDFEELKEKLDYNEIPYEEGYDEGRECLFFPNEEDKLYTAYSDGSLDGAYADIIGKFFGGTRERAAMAAMGLAALLGMGMAGIGRDGASDLMKDFEEFKKSHQKDDPDDPTKLYWE